MSRPPDPRTRDLFAGTYIPLEEPRDKPRVPQILGALANTYTVPDTASFVPIEDRVLYVPNLDSKVALLLFQSGFERVSYVAFHVRRLNDRWPLADRVYRVIRRAGDSLDLETYRRAADVLAEAMRGMDGVE